MLRSATVLLTIAIISAVLGYSGLSAGTSNIARIIFFIAMILFMLALVFDLGTKKER